MIQTTNNLSRNGVRPNFWFIFFVVFMLFAIKALIILNDGWQFGRLALPPVYDDVVYFSDGIKRLAIYKESGLWGVTLNLFNNLPHSPYATLASFLSFAVAGSVRSGPYFVNAITAALLVSWLLKKFAASLSLAALLALVLISLPWFDHLITIFHPDLMAGLGTAVVGAIIIWQHETVRTRWDAFEVGLVAGWVLLIKPSAIIMMVILWSAAFGIASLWQFEAGRIGFCPPTRETFRRLGVAFLGVTLASGWYLAPAFPSIVGYIYHALIVDSDTWALKISITAHALYYIQISYNYFGYWLPAIPLLFLIAPLATADARERGNLLIGSVSLVTMFSIAYIIPSVTPIKVALFGGMIYGIIVIGIVVSFIQINRSIFSTEIIQLFFVKITAKSLKRLFFLGLVIGVMMTIGDHQWRVPQVWIDDHCLLYERIFTICKDKLTSSRHKDVILFWPTMAPVGPLALEFRGEVEGVKIVLAPKDQQPKIRPNFETNLETLKRGATISDIVVIPDDELAMATKFFPVTRIIRPFREWLSANSQFRQVSELAIRPASELAIGGGKIFIFENDHRLAAPP